MNHEIAAAISCANCESFRVIRVGFTTIDGFYCEACKRFTETNGKSRLVKSIREFHNGMLFKADLIFETMRPSKKTAFKPKTIIRKSTSEP